MPERHLRVAGDDDAAFVEQLRHLAELRHDLDHAIPSQRGPIGKAVAEQQDAVIAEMHRLGLFRPVGVAGCTPPAWRDIHGGLDAYGNPFDEDEARGSGIR